MIVCQIRKEQEKNEREIIVRDFFVSFFSPKVKNCIRAEN